jgi:hypothetical protein
MEKLYKARKGKKEFKQYPEKVDKLRDLFSSMGSKHDKPLSKSSVDNYTNKINKLSTVVLEHGFNGDFNWLKDSDNVISKLKNSELASAKDYLSPVVKLLKHLDAHQDTIAKYQRAMAEFKDDEYKVRKTNKATPKEIENSLDYNEIIKRLNAYKPKDDMELIFKLIVSMYFQNSLVPRNDLPNMKFVSTSKKANQLNPEFNYITLDKNGTPIDIIMQNYKSRNTYGRQKFPISPEVRDLLKQYIKLFGKKAGDFLFVMKDGQPFKKPNFTDLIGNATEAVLGKRINIDLMRSIQISHYYNQHAHSIQQDEDDARRYLHSSNMHKEYLKLGLTGDDE